MAKPLKIEVTQPDIDRAMSIQMFPAGGWGQCCPLGQSLARTGFENFYVGLVTVNIGKKNYLLSDEAKAYITNVDRTHNTAWRRTHPDEVLYPILPATFILKEQRRA